MHGLCRDCLESLATIRGDVCGTCGKGLAYKGLCPECSKSGTRHHWDMRRAVLIYDDVNAGLIKLGKYRQDKPVLVSLSQLMAEAYEKYYSRFPFDIVVPVPLSRKKRSERGFNQAEVLASSLPLEIDANLCVRAKDTPPQSSFEKDSQRWNNVTGVFVVKKKLNGKKILIVDDVVTSGATTGEMACVLKKAGAESVCVLSLAAARS